MFREEVLLLKTTSASWLNRSCGLTLSLLCLSGGIGAAEAVEFQLPDLAGKEHRLSDYRGKWVVVNYWATWCPPCQEELPELEIFHHGNAASRAVVLGVNMERIGIEQLRAFTEDQFLSYPILVGGPEPTQPFGEVPGLPTTFLINRQGEVVARHVGPITAKAIEQLIEGYETRQQGRGT